RRGFQGLVTRAMDHLRLLEENRDLKEERIGSATVEHVRPPGPHSAERQTGSSLPLLRFARVFRRHESIDTVLAGVVEGLADVAGVSRVGIFSRARQDEKYTL